MKKLGWKFVLIGSLTLLGLGLLWPPQKTLKLGIDLSGGTILVYEVEPQGRNTARFNMDELIAALKRRVNPEGVLDTTIRPVGGDRVEIILPEASVEKVEEVKRKLSDVGSLEFRILANEKHDRRAIESIRTADGYRKEPPKGYRWARLGEVISGTNPQIRGLALTDPKQQWRAHRYAGGKGVVSLTGKDGTGAERTESIPVADNTGASLTLEKSPTLKSISSYRLDYNPSEIQPSDKSIVREEQVGPNRIERYVLYKEPPERQNVTGKYLAAAYQQHDEDLKPAVGFTFDREGARRFGNLTRAHLPEEDGAFKYSLAIILDGVVMSAPVINSYISDAGQISMGRTGSSVVKEVAYLIQILQSGSLPASLKPTPEQEEQIGPTLGRDTIEKGLRAIWISMLVVPLFMIVYYRFAGVVAVVALMLNMILLLATMAFTGATFTLPGLAGLALTIGMSVDANVLIFERMREEAERGAGLAQQIRNGFAKAWSTILDSNVTTILSGIVLWGVGTEEIKGFAVTLIIGLVWNLFTAVFVSRAIFDFFYQQGWLKKLTMMRILNKTNLDFIGPRRYCMVGSALIIALGLAVFFSKGQALYNIDFTGGSLVTIRLDSQGPDIRGRTVVQRSDFVRRTASASLPDVTVESLNLVGEEPGQRFNVRTTDDNVTDVMQRLQKAFGANLAHVEMTAGPPQSIDAPKETGAKPESEAKSGEAPASKWSRRYDLTFNAPFWRMEAPERAVASNFAHILAQAKVDSPEARFAIEQPDTPAGAEPKLVLATDLPPDQAQGYLAELEKTLESNPDLIFERHEKFGATVAGETRATAALAIVFSWMIIIAYLWFRFKSVTYGVAAVIALIHDVLITLGAVALSPYKIDLPMVAAFLTLIGFSVNDTIVIFDRIRELKGKSPVLTEQLINLAVNETLSRTILTSLTAWLVVVILYLFGGEGLHGFSFCLVVGFLSGTYSTIYIASPVLIEWAGKPSGQAAGKKSLVTSR